ncbi:MAG TPA: RNA polymerase factor sigma-54 [bacterium]|jgi:RNA polymerase sigma-54 factor
MQLATKLSLKMTQKLVMTPQLQQAIRLLQLSRLDLLQAIRQEMVENPVLEEEIVEEEEIGEAAAQEKEAGEPVDGRDAEEFDWEGYLNSSIGSGFQAGTGLPVDDGERPTIENTYSVSRSLTDHLIWQLRVDNLPDEVKEIGACLIGCLDSDGYLRDNEATLVNLCHCDPDAMSRTLAELRKFDPAGVFARNLTHCLLLQIDQLRDPHPLLRRIVSNHLKDLESRRYKEVARQLDTTVDDLLAAVHELQQLEPKPGRRFDSDTPFYVVPDVFVIRKGDRFEIRLNDEGLPRPRISPYYLEMYKKHNGIDGDRESKEFIKAKLNNALALIKSLDQRQKTIYRTTESILRFQNDFFLKGTNYLRPLILRDVAEDLGMHESTISRVTSNKYLHCDRGIFELKYFFSSSLKTTQGEDLSAVYVKNRLRQIIEEEDKNRCLSDQVIADLLAKENIKIARRTVAKYRDELKILPISSRKRGY